MKQSLQKGKEKKHNCFFFFFKVGKLVVVTVENQTKVP